jgi:light-regulated signal transduction histidine kinase (bacteriophytochrome)
MIYERKDGQKIHGLLSISLIKDENGLVLESRSVVVDITERKQVEEELEKHRNHLEEMIGIRTAELGKRISEVEQLNSAMVNLTEDLRVSNDSLTTRTQQLTEANKELDAFAYSVSHDLRAPLRAIDGFSQMLVEDYGDKLDGEGQHQLDVIQGSARQMGQLIDDLLAFSRLGRRELKMSDINMRALAEEVIKQFQIIEPERTMRLKVDALPPALGDRSMIREVFANLLSNALKYTAPREAAVIEASGKTDGNESIYSVKDNGVGFDMKYADKLFQVFQRLHSADEFEGTGIGLALVKRIIQRHGGRVWAEGKVNEGATFYFSLPRG